MTRGMCENCLTVSDFANEYNDRTCGSCGHKTSATTSTALYRVMRGVAENKIKSKLTNGLREMIDYSGGLRRMNLGAISIDVSQKKLLERLYLDVLGCVSLEDIEKVGAVAVKDLVQKKKKLMEEVYLIRPLDPAIAARIVAHLYDPEEPRGGL